MKKLYALLALLFAFTASGFAQSDAPDAVKTAFGEKFPGVSADSWVEEDGEWEVQFSDIDGAADAKFTANGEWISTERKMPGRDLPRAILNAVNAKFANAEYGQAEMIESAKEGAVYEVEIETDAGEHIEMLISPTGEILAQETEDDGDD